MRRALLAFLLAAAPPARATLVSDVGGSAGQFLQLGAGARALGMGEAMVAAAEGPDALHWNPAGLSRMRRPEVLYSRAQLPGATAHDFAAASVPVRWLRGTLAVGLTRLSQASIDRVDNLGRARGSFAPHSEAFTLGYSHSFVSADHATLARDYFRDTWNLPGAYRPMKDEEEPWTGAIAVGFALKGVSETLGDRRATTAALDFGGSFRPHEFGALTVAAAARNLFGRQRFISESAALPAEAAFGASLDLRSESERRDESWRVVPALEVVAPYHGAPYGKLGVEYAHPFGEGAAGLLRLGYNTRPAPALGAVAGLAVGAGVKAGRFSFDAGFTPMGDLGSAFRLGAGWRF
ncbi:MAG: hypothetical protein SF051_00470 [Elusimicrobiota bacterium]|nr:hypothetical protein [Elusimicrobiota bacterium]